MRFGTPLESALEVSYVSRELCFQKVLVSDNCLPLVLLRKHISARTSCAVPPPFQLILGVLEAPPGHGGHTTPVTPPVTTGTGTRT